MTTAKELGEQFAHPGIRDEIQNGFIVSRQFWGMTKRELLAAMAMQAIIGKHKPILANTKMVYKFSKSHAAGATAYADALLAELAKDQP